MPCCCQWPCKTCLKMPESTAPEGIMPVSASQVKSRPTGRQRMLFRTTVRALTWCMRTSCSAHLSACMCLQILKEWVWAWPMSNALLSGMGDASGRRARRTWGPLFISPCPGHLKPDGECLAIIASAGRFVKTGNVERRIFFSRQFFELKVPAAHNLYAAEAMN